MFSYGVQNSTVSSSGPNSAHKDTIKFEKNENFKNVLKCQKTDSRVSLDTFRGLQSLILENDGRGTGLKNEASWYVLIGNIICKVLSSLLAGLNTMFPDFVNIFKNREIQSKLIQISTKSPNGSYWVPA